MIESLCTTSKEHSITIVRFILVIVDLLLYRLYVLSYNDLTNFL